MNSFDITGGYKPQPAPFRITLDDLKPRSAAERVRLAVRYCEQENITPEPKRVKDMTGLSLAAVYKHWPNN